MQAVIVERTVDLIRYARYHLVDLLIFIFRQALINVFWDFTVENTRLPLPVERLSSVVCLNSCNV